MNMTQKKNHQIHQQLKKRATEDSWNFKQPPDVMRQIVWHMDMNTAAIRRNQEIVRRREKQQIDEDNGWIAK